MAALRLTAALNCTSAPSVVCQLKMYTIQYTHNTYRIIYRLS